MFTKTVRLALALSACLASSACVPLIVGGAAGAGAYAYVRGELKETLSASPTQTQQAIESAIARLDLVVIAQSADGLTGNFDLQTGDYRRVSIRYKRVADLATTVTIRVGTLGDKGLSDTILREIKIAL